MRPDLEEMSGGPAKRSLQRLVPAIELYGERSCEATHDLRLDDVESDLEASNGYGIHASSLRRT